MMTETDTLYSSLGEAERYAKDLEARLEEAYADGIDEACRQANEYLAEGNSTFRFVNAGLNTVCKVSVDDPSFAQWEEFHAKRQAALKAKWESENRVPCVDSTDRPEAGLT